MAFLVFVFTLAILSWRVEEPGTLVFDELHYVPAAVQIVNLKPNNNYEHPPLAKELIGLGLLAFGENAFGARISSCIFGAILCVTLFCLSGTLFGAWGWGLLTLLIVGLDGFTYVLSRVAMLEIFWVTFAFLALTVLYQIQIWNWKKALLVGTLLGAAVACKWTALLTWPIALYLILIKPKRSRFATGLALFVVPLFVYAASYLPILALDGPQFGFWSLVQMQTAMWTAQTLKIAHHPEFSEWYQWPFLLDPMWLTKNPPIYLRGNLVTMIFGLTVGLLALRTPKFRVLPLAYLAFFLPWAIIPRENTFYYYYFPAVLILDLNATLGVYLLSANLRFSSRRDIS